MYSNKLYSPLRYPGGKARFAPFIANLIHCNGLEGGHYLEPYAGGAGVGLELLFHNIVSHIHINDVDSAVYDFWVAVTRFPDDILRMLHNTPVTMEQWHYWHNVLQGNIDVGQVERGFATLFLNRTNRSGILKGGVIGGKGQSGTYRLDARFKKDILAKRIERIALQANHISVYKEDALVLLRKHAEILPAKSLIYLDPPYYVKGQGLYRNFYSHRDHEEIAKLVQLKGFAKNWVVSYDRVVEIEQMYSTSNVLRYSLHYTAQARYTGKEVMFFSANIKLPDYGLPK